MHIFKRRYFLLAAVLSFIISDIGSNGGCYLEKQYKIRVAHARILAVLEGITLREDLTGTIGNEQLAVCRWWSDTAVVADLEELNRAVDAFDRWKQRGGLGNYITEFTIDKIIIEGDEEEEDDDDGTEDANEVGNEDVGSNKVHYGLPEFKRPNFIFDAEAEEEEEPEEEPEPGPTIFIVHGTINGGNYIMRAPASDTITWIQNPW